MKEHHTVERVPAFRDLLTCAQHVGGFVHVYVTTCSLYYDISATVLSQILLALNISESKECECGWRTVRAFRDSRYAGR